MSGCATLKLAMSWNAVYSHLLHQPAGTVVPIAKTALADPRLCGAEVSVGWPSGQSADYRFPPDATCQGLHVHEFADRWEVHLDRVHPSCDLLEHLRQDAPQALCATTTSIGAVIGGLAGRTLASALFGGGVGLILGLVVSAIGRK